MDQNEVATKLFGPSPVLFHGIGTLKKWPYVTASWWAPFPQCAGTSAPKTGTAGDCHDDEMCESFFGALEAKLLTRERFETPEQARCAIFRIIEGCGYNVPSPSQQS
ncbi:MULTISPECIES: hypothetical protein [unclassified Paraburkholderia]|uniref:hypothetical protein n=1 Tax=unclassified Paraburkholderia TaxID=2615204 RepID=UPI00160FCF9E|nr:MULTISPECIES: hypothetical protein [unclassified Paraburkholderia]MBB5445177.1 hypothetical protein [Paraburkholderia sp. WSM4177]MBB5485725.1 hypothetical protein [Paraburkholderia sp. WSM4180]